MKAKVSIHRNNKPRRIAKPSKPRNQPGPLLPRKRTKEENAKALEWHAAEMRKEIEFCMTSLAKAQRKLDKLFGGVGMLDAMRIHLDCFEHIAKEEAAKCK